MLYQHILVPIDGSETSMVAMKEAIKLGKALNSKITVVQVMALDPLAEKWRAFGWNAVEVNGHDFEELLPALSKFPNENNKPTAIIAHTVKRKGASFMEDDNNWHYRIPNKEEVSKSKIELGII
jgi:transketolase